MIDPPAWGDDWSELRALWSIDPTVTFLNHGAFGATPLPVLAEQSRLRAEMEAQPIDFLDRRYPQLYATALEAIAGFLGADADRCTFISNASTGTATVLSSLAFSPGDEIVATTHTYDALANALHRLAATTGARVVPVDIPLPLSGPEVVVDLVAATITDRTKLLVIDAATSVSAIVLPITDLVAVARSAGVQILVDAAHAPGMLPVDLRTLRPDYWVGNLHKWACAPKGAAVLYADAQHLDALRPLITSHGYGGGFREEFRYNGTLDVTPWLAAPAAVDLLSAIGWDRIREYGGALARYGQRLGCAAVGTEPLVPGAMTAMMSLVPLPRGVGADRASALAISERLWVEHRIEVPVGACGGRGLLRLSGHVHNSAVDYEHLADVLPSAIHG